MPVNKKSVINRVKLRQAVGSRGELHTSVVAATMVVRCITINQTCPTDASDGIIQLSTVSTTQKVRISTEYIQPTLSMACMHASLAASPVY